MLTASLFFGCAGIGRRPSSGDVVSVRYQGSVLRCVLGGGDRCGEAQDPPAGVSTVQSVESVCLSWEIEPTLQP